MLEIMLVPISWRVLHLIYTYGAGFWSRDWAVLLTEEVSSTDRSTRRLTPEVSAVAKIQTEISVVMIRCRVYGLLNDAQWSRLSS
jgi:hypothetical protein